MVEPSVVEARLRENIEGITHLELRDLTGTKDHYEAVIVATSFAEKSMVETHQMVYGALGELIMGSNAPVHALTMKTFTPAKWEAQP